MRIYLYTFLIISSLISCDNQSKLSTDEYIVNVKAEGVFNGLRAYLKTNTNPRSVKTTDTAIVSNGSFSFRGKINGVEMRTLTIDGLNGQTNIVLEPGKIQVTIYKDSIFSSTSVGTPNNDVFDDYKKQYKKQYNVISSLRDSILKLANNPIILKQLKIKMKSQKILLKNFGFNFIKTYPDSDFSLTLLNSALGQKGFDIDLAKEAYDKINISIKTKTVENQIISNQIKTKLNKAKKTELVKIGEKVPAFSGPNSKGILLDLNKIKGKVTIIDFWASWCKPCRIENPNLVNLYDKYHDNGLEIISISLDSETQRLAWIKAIKKDQLNWFNISNLKSWNDPIAQLYGVNSIPATFIIDQDGVLIDKQLRGRQLDERIRGLLDL
ncbi:MAG: AhpC/TSA family protein [Formosa sp.]|jgi:thiol-disulfide isomerase/thioredoxin|nr:AhpC/TSA family protein [Formosa sp.]MDC3198627.1 AhpC/TSA family protein [Flavobacteriaceae bacterium]